MKIKSLYVSIVTAMFLTGLATSACAEWNFGIGTGPQLLAVKGDIGMDTSLGAVQLEVDLDAGDMADATDTAFGFGGYATDGKWKIQYKLGKLQLEEEGARGTRTGSTLTANIDFDITEAELTVGYPFYQNPSFVMRGYGGVRYLRHEYELNLSGTGFVAINRHKSIDESWTDALIGVSADMPFAEKWNWNVKADAGFGGSEGTYLASTSVTWRFYGNWSSTLAATYKAVEYENSSRGAADWYLYDVDEKTLGLAILYNW